MVSFAYRREFSQVLGEILRPVASVQVRAVRGHWFPALMYIDSGADITLVPSDFGKLLGMDLSKNRASLAGVTGTPLRVSLQSAEVKIGSALENAKIAVATRNDVPYLLGREGLFKAFKITFEEYRSLTSFDHQSKDPSSIVTFAKTAEKKGLTIKDALRQAAQRWTLEESGIDPSDPIFDIAAKRRKAQDWGRGRERASREVDKTLYGK